MPEVNGARSKTTLSCPLRSALISITFALRCLLIFLSTSLGFRGQGSSSLFSSRFRRHSVGFKLTVRAEIRDEDFDFALLRAMSDE